MSQCWYGHFPLVNIVTAVIAVDVMVSKVCYSQHDHAQAGGGYWDDRRRDQAVLVRQAPGEVRAK
jgi:hypothetical protein